MKDTFIIRTEWAQAIFELPEPEQATIFKNLFHFHMGEENLINLNNLSVKLVWRLIEPTLKRNVEAYDRRSDTSSENGKKGGRPKKEAEENLINLNKPNEKPIETKEPIESLSVYDSVSVSDYDNDLNKSVDAEFLQNSATHKPVSFSPAPQSEKKENPHPPVPAAPPPKPEYGDGVLQGMCREYEAENKGKYPPKLYREFLMYWTAVIQNGKKSEIGKEKWRVQETFQLASRLATWFNRTPTDNAKSNRNLGSTAVFGDDKDYSVRV